MTSCYDVGVLTGSLLEQPEEGEAALFERLKAADPTALRATYREHNEAVRAFARRLVGNDADAEELVQEVFIALPAAMRGFRATSSLRTFVLGIAANHARHFVRAAARRRAAAARLSREPVDVVSPPDEALLREQLSDRLLRAMDLLPMEQRIAFVLCEVEERSSEEAALILGEASSTLRSRVGAARKKLRELLKEERT
jgi:RNA polymerase sigma-70 factor (ECF subfamily)